MLFRSLVSSLLALPLLAASQTAAAADPLKELASFSTFKSVDLEKLAGGTVLAARGPAMSSPKDLAIELCYVIPKPLAKATEFHQRWNPLRHPELKVYLHSDISNPPKPGDFQKLSSAPSNAAVKALAAATQKLSGRGGELQLSEAEAKAFSGDGGGSGGLPPAVAQFWSSVLMQRAQAFLSGGIGRLPAYDMGRESVRPAEEVARLLKGAGKIRSQFSSLLDGTGLTGKGSLPPSPYWELINIEDQAAVTLGVAYAKGGADAWQSVDAQYYASSGYYTYLTLYQMWPVTIGGRESTLVWRGDLLSAASLADLHGVERMGATSAMMKETQKAAEAMQRDGAKGQ